MNLESRRFITRISSDEYTGKMTGREIPSSEPLLDASILFCYHDDAQDRAIFTARD